MDSEVIKEFMAVNGDGKKYVKLCNKCGEKFIVHARDRDHPKWRCNPK